MSDRSDRHTLQENAWRSAGPIGELVSPVGGTKVVRENSLDAGSQVLKGLQN